MSRLLDGALELDAVGRRRWLRILAPEYRELEPVLRQALLPEQIQAADTDPFATLPRIGAGDEASPIAGGPRPGERIGPYLFVRLLGTGGMAEVWLARRADGAFQREVALKVPRLSRLRQDLISRFGRERDILASLEHPNIARLYDAGVSAEGLPYLAMEFVAGQPLTAWCDAHRLDIGERLKLFLQVLDAVQYAHRHHVVHRDIKPSNILVTDSGQVRLLDFGVAKVLADEQVQTGQTELTRLYGQALTPEYASPELARGEPIGVAADVYSLGVVLYELLCGSRPYRLKTGASAPLLERAIATARIERPSSRLGVEASDVRGATQHKLARRLRGDLDAIVLRALAKVPADRYGSVAALADDLRRYLGGEPVEGRPDRSPHRFTGLELRRELGRTVFAVAVAIAVAAGSGYALTRLTGLEPVAPTNMTSEYPDTAVETADDRSIAVLPFVDLSEKRDQEFFCDGLAEEIVAHLSHTEGVKVISRTSSFYFKGKQVTIGEIGRKLGVRNVLEGSVRKSGSVVRITVQLIRSSDSSHRWSQTYERSLNDLFKVQDEVSESVAQALKVALVRDPLHVAPRKRDSEISDILLADRVEYR